MVGFEFKRNILFNSRGKEIGRGYATCKSNAIISTLFFYSSHIATADWSALRCNPMQMKWLFNPMQIKGFFNPMQSE